MDCHCHNRLAVGLSYSDEFSTYISPVEVHRFGSQIDLFCRSKEFLMKCLSISKNAFFYNSLVFIWKQIRVWTTKQIQKRKLLILHSGILMDVLWEEFEDTKGVIRIRESKDRQHNGQKKKYKRTIKDLQNIHIKLKIE